MAASGDANIEFTKNIESASNDANNEEDYTQEQDNEILRFYSHEINISCLALSHKEVYEFFDIVELHRGRKDPWVTMAP